MKITPLPAAASSSSSLPMPMSRDSGPIAETKPEDDVAFTWGNLVAKLDICERCMIVGMFASAAVELACLVVWPFRRSPGVSIHLLRNAMLGGFLCYFHLFVFLAFYMQWKHTPTRLREVELTASSSSSASASDASDLV